MSTLEQIRSLNPGDRICWGPQNPCAGWVIVNNTVGLLCGWDGGELTVWRYADTALMLRVGEHITLVMRGQDL